MSKFAVITGVLATAALALTLATPAMAATGPKIDNAPIPEGTLPKDAKGFLNPGKLTFKGGASELKAEFANDASEETRISQSLANAGLKEGFLSKNARGHALAPAALAATYRVDVSAISVDGEIDLGKYFAGSGLKEGTMSKNAKGFLKSGVEMKTDAQ